MWFAEIGAHLTFGNDANFGIKQGEKSGLDSFDGS